MDTMNHLHQEEATPRMFLSSTTADFVVTDYNTATTPSFVTEEDDSDDDFGFGGEPLGGTGWNNVNSNETSITDTTTMLSISHGSGFGTSSAMAIYEEERNEPQHPHALNSNANFANTTNDEEIIETDDDGNTMDVGIEKKLAAVDDCATSTTMSPRDKLEVINSLIGNHGHRRENVKQRFQKIFGSKLQEKLNIIEKLGTDQEIIAHDQSSSVESSSSSLSDIQKEATEACLQLIKEHLEDFLQEQPDGTYEEWIEDLHPENAHENKLLLDFEKEIDLRFYVLESDHRLLWNDHHQHMPLRIISPRSTAAGKIIRRDDDNHHIYPPIDLLDDSINVPMNNNEAALVSPPRSLPLSTGGDDQKKEDIDLISF